MDFARFSSVWSVLLENATGVQSGHLFDRFVAHAALAQHPEELKGDVRELPVGHVFLDRVFRELVGTAGGIVREGETVCVPALDEGRDHIGPLLVGARSGKADAIHAALQ